MSYISRIKRFFVGKSNGSSPSQSSKATTSEPRCRTPNDNSRSSRSGFFTILSKNVPLFKLCPSRRHRRSAARNRKTRKSSRVKKSTKDISIPEISDSSAGVSKTIKEKARLNKNNIDPNEELVISTRRFKSKAKVRFYKHVPLDPQVNEVLSAPPVDLSRNLVKGAYRSPAHYLNVHVKLLREDCMAPLREGKFF